MQDPHFDLTSGKPEIVYPCRWEYRTIGLDEDLMRAAIAEAVAGREHSVSFSHSSQGGKYCSLLLAVTVESERHRNDLFMFLQGHRDIKMVL